MASATALASKNGCQCYFAYGSNMRLARMQERGLEVVDQSSAWVTGLGLRFNKTDAAHAGSGHANIVYAPGEWVEGVLYTLASPGEIFKMDPYEKAPWNYGRDALWVNLGRFSPPAATPTTQQAAWTYFANPAVQQEGLAPTQDYLDHLLAGASHLSKAYVERLRRQPISKPAAVVPNGGT